jgi:hypothetical protein
LFPLSEEGSAFTHRMSELAQINADHFSIHPDQFSHTKDAGRTFLQNVGKTTFIAWWINTKDYRKLKLNETKLHRFNRLLAIPIFVVIRWFPAQIVNDSELYTLIASNIRIPVNL